MISITGIFFLIKKEIKEVFSLLYLPQSCAIKSIPIHQQYQKFFFIANPFFHPPQILPIDILQLRLRLPILGWGRGMKFGCELGPDFRHLNKP
jgi:hypothetical protein